MISALIIILLCQLIGEIIAIGSGIPVPGPVIGMTILFVGLLLAKGVTPSLETLSDKLLAHLSLLFVPAGVGVMMHFELLGRELLPVAMALVLSTLATLLVTGWIMQTLARSGDDLEQ
jgi:holin-like protein